MMRGIRQFFLTLALVAAFVFGALAVEYYDMTSPHNRFVVAFNDYTTAMNGGVKDLKKIAKAQKLFRQLAKAEGWPEEKGCKE